MINTLIVDDEKPFRDLLKKKLEKEGQVVSAVGTAEAALEKVGQQDYDVAILDISLPDTNGIELLKNIRQTQPGLECVMLTGYASIESAIEAMKEGAYHYLEKPGKISELKLVVSKAYEKSRLSREIQNVKEERKRQGQSYKMVGDSKVIDNIRKIIHKVAPTDSSVLIEGESGTGKELVAREIHNQSQRADGSFISIDCGAVQETLFENELFGHAKGAYTGADKAQVGLIELADRGTLFIDEVGELELNMQKKFLRFLETGEFRRLGDNKLRRVDVRVLAATNRVLKQEVEDGKFRQDLYYRLDVVNIQVKPLRERKEDIPLLVEHFLKGHAQGGKTRQIDDDAMEVLTRYDWPGNIRELRNVVERAVILSSGKITADDLPNLPGPDPEFSSDESEGEDNPQVNEFKDLAALEKEHIQRALKVCQGNKTQAAKILGISLRSLYRKLEKYEIEL